MYKYILENAGNINWMAIFALITFVTLFVISTLVILGRNKKFVDRMANLPFDDATVNLQISEHENDK